MVNLGNDWDELLKNEFKKDYYLSLRQFLARSTKQKLYIPICIIFFEALKITSYKDTKVLILGQDPIMEKIKLMAWLFQYKRE